MVICLIYFNEIVIHNKSPLLRTMISSDAWYTEMTFIIKFLHAILGAVYRPLVFMIPCMGTNYRTTWPMISESSNVLCSMLGKTVEAVSD